MRFFARRPVILLRRSSTAARRDEGFNDEHRDYYGVEPMCRVLPIAPSTYFAHAATKANTNLRSDRAKRDDTLSAEIRRVFDENFHVYGIRKVWRQMQREGFAIARCMVERLMKAMGVKGVIRGQEGIRTTIPDDQAYRPLDLVNRQFKAQRPNALWVADFTYVATGQGFAYVAFVVDVYARRIVGWKLSHSAKTDFVLDALEQALYARKPYGTGPLIHHSDRGSQYVSIRYSERLAEAGIESSVGSVGDSYDNALAETINGLYKAEVIYRRRSWRSHSEVELATLEWVDGFNHRRLLGPIGDIPPAEAERLFWETMNPPAIAAYLNQKAFGKPGAVHLSDRVSLGMGDEESLQDTAGRRGRAGSRVGATNLRSLRDQDCAGCSVQGSYAYSGEPLAESSAE